MADAGKTMSFQATMMGIKKEAKGEYLTFSPKKDP